ncbi:hypothetical protein C8J56DRAFT_337773, partial [Mycena floridula]
PIFIVCNLKHNVHQADRITGPDVCFATNISIWILSFCANISATLTIFYTAWCYHVSQRTLIAAAALPPRRSAVARIMQVIVESGLVYLLTMIVSVPVLVWPTPSYSPSTVIVQVMFQVIMQCIVMIPTLTILLISLYGSFDREYFAADLSQPIRFATNPGITASFHKPGI